MRRHRLGASLSLALLLAVAAGVGGVVWQSAQKAREARRAAATRDFLLGIFQGGDPRVPRSKPRGQTTARELLDLAAARIDHDLRDDPETRLELLDLTATSYLYLDELPKAREFARLAKEAGAEEYAADDPRQIDLVFFEIWADLQASDRPAAAAHLSQLDQSLRQAGLDHSRHRAEYFLAQGDLAQLDKDPAGREKALREAAALFAEVAPEDSGYPATLANLAAIAFNRDQLERAAELYQTALTAALKRPEAELERTRLASRRGRVLTELGRYQEAENDLTRARRGFAATLGQDHPTAWQATAALARLNCLEGRHQEADALFATLPSERPGESPGLAERWAEAKLLQGLCLAQRPDHQAEGARLLRETSAILAGQAEAQADLRRAAAALAAL